MRGFVLAVAVLAACGATPRPARPAEVLPEPEVASPGEPPERPSVEEPMPQKSLLPRPQLRLLTLLPRDVTWPLSGEPTSGPHHTPGASWTTLCERRGRLSPSALDYVLAWCAYRSDERFDLLAALVALRPIEPALAEAVRHDIAYRLAATRVGSEIRAWLDTHRADSHMRDLVVAMLAEEGRHDEAIAIDATIPRDGAPGTTCPRETRLAMMLPVEHRNFAALGNPAFHGTPCGTRAHALYLSLANVDTRPDELIDTPVNARLLRAYNLWARIDRRSEPWLEVAELAESALALPEAERFAVTALDNAVRTSCKKTIVFAVNLAASRLRVSPHHNEIYETEVAELAALTPERCRTR